MIEDGDVQARSFEILLNAPGMACRNQPTIRHEQHAFRTKPTREFSSAIHHSGAEDNTRTRLIIERRKPCRIIAELMTHENAPLRIMRAEQLVRRPAAGLRTQSANPPGLWRGAC